MRLMTMQQWNQRGMRVMDGARSNFRGAGGVCLFTQNQVVPFDRPKQVSNIVQINGRYYREI